MILKIGDNITPAQRMERTHVYELVSSLIDIPLLQYDKIFKGVIDEGVCKWSIEDMKFSEVINKYGYVYDEISDILYVDTDNTEQLYTNDEFVDFFLDEVRECIKISLREYNINKIGCI